MRSSRMWMRSSRVVRASDCQCQSRNNPGFDPSIFRHSGIWEAANEAVLNIIHKKKIFNPTYNRIFTVLHLPTFSTHLTTPMTLPYSGIAIVRYLQEIRKPQHPDFLPVAETDMLRLSLKLAGRWPDGANSNGFRSTYTYRYSNKNTC